MAEETAARTLMPDNVAPGVGRVRVGQTSRTVLLPFQEVDHQRRSLVGMRFQQEMRPVENVCFHPRQGPHP